MECPNCGQILEPHWHFCDKCGEPIYIRPSLTLSPAPSQVPPAPVYPYCTGCGTHIEAGHFYCTKCGMPRYGLALSPRPQYYYQPPIPNPPRNYKPLASFISAIITSIVLGYIVFIFLNNISPLTKDFGIANVYGTLIVFFVPLITALICSLRERVDTGSAIAAPIFIGILAALIVCLIIYLLTAAVFLGMVFLLTSIPAGTYIIYAVVVKK